MKLIIQKNRKNCKKKKVNWKTSSILLYIKISNYYPLAKKEKFCKKRNILKNNARGKDKLKYNI